MSYKSIIIGVFTFAIMTSCLQDEAVNEQDEVVIEDNYAITIDSNSKSTNSIDTLSSSEPQQQTQNQSSSNQKTINVNSDNKSSNIDPKDNAAEELATAEDLEAEMKNKVNRNVNPDNQNGVADIDKESYINLIPVYSATDKSKFYVQFATKVHKISKSDLAKIFKDTQDIYVIQNQGLFQYCVGQFEDEATANNYKKKADKEFGFKDSQVVSFKQAW